MTLPVDEINGRTIPLQGFVIAGGGPGAPGNVLVNTAQVDLYVSDINGNDANNGLAPATPVKTLAGALSKITFQVVAFDVIIHVGAHGGAGYTWATLEGYVLIDGASIYVYADGAGQPGEDGFTVLVATVASAAGTTTSVVKSTAALGVNAYRGKTIEIVSGACAGNRRTISYNTATDIVPTVVFDGAIAPGDTYRILESDVALDTPGFPSQTLLARGVGHVRTASDFFFANAAPSALYVVGFSGFDNSFIVEDSAVIVVGCEGSATYSFMQVVNSEIGFGETDQNGLQASAIVVGEDEWHGWGWGAPPTSIFPEGGRSFLHGFFVAMTLGVSGAFMFVVVRGGDFTGDGANYGSITAYTSTAGVSGDVVIEVGDYYGSAGATPMNLRATGVGAGYNAIACVHASGPRSFINFPILISPSTVVLTSDTVCLFASDGGQIGTSHAFDTGVVVNAGTFGALALSGGVIGLTHDWIAAFTANPAPSGDCSVNMLTGRPVTALTVTARSAYTSPAGSKVYRS